jgi:hypothetical protein
MRFDFRTTRKLIIELLGALTFSVLKQRLGGGQILDAIALLRRIIGRKSP